MSSITVPNPANGCSYPHVCIIHLYRCDCAAYNVHLDPKITLETCTDQSKQLKSASIYFRKLLYCHSILYYMSHASCTQKLVFSLKAHLHLQMCAYLVTSSLRWNVALFLLFVCLQEFPHPEYMYTCTWFCTCLAQPCFQKTLFSNQAFAPACVSNQAVGRQVHPAKACCEILWLSWSPTHCCELQNGGFCQSFTFLLRRHCIKFSETF